MPADVGTFWWGAFDDQVEILMFKIFGHYVSRLHFVLGIVEFIAFVLAAHAGFYTRFKLLAEGIDEIEAPLLASSLIYAIAMTSSMVALGLYQRGNMSHAAMFVRVIVAFALGTGGLSVVFYLFPDLFFGRGVYAFALFYSLVLVALTRTVFNRFAHEDVQRHRVLVLGSGKSASSVLHNEGQGFGYKVVRFIRLSPREQEVDNDRVGELSRPLLRFVEENDIDEIVIAADDRRGGLPLDDILDCKMSGIRIFDLISFFEKETSKINIDFLNPGWIIFSNGFQMSLSTRYGKRFFDIVVSLSLLLLASPFMLAVAIASILESRGRDPVFYHQVRVGKDNKPFRVHKFRSMRADAESDGVARWATKNDNRVTRLGRFIRKTRLDELPQLWNVLVGEMSMVGPRPERPEFVEKLAENIPFYSERHRVKPGVTGWAQVRYQYAETEEDTREKLQYDLYYVKNASLFLDLIVLLETVEVVLWGKGAQ